MGKVLPFDSGQTVHVKVVDVRGSGGDPVLEFEVLDEGPLLGERLEGRPDCHVTGWVGTLLDRTSAHVEDAHVPVERVLHKCCRAVIGVSGRVRQHHFVKAVLPP
jgi:hypothetical protein